MEFTVDPRPMVLTLLGRRHSNDRSPDQELNRRRLLKLAVSSIVGAQLPGRLLHAQSELQSCSPPIPQKPQFVCHRSISLSKLIRWKALSAISQ